MHNRNGIDKLTVALTIMYCLFTPVKSLLKYNLKVYIVLSVLQYSLLAFILYRVFSRNVQKRYKENFKFEMFLEAWKPYFNRMKLRLTYIRTHRFRTCKNCGEFLRLKRVRGKKETACPKCGTNCKFFILF